MKKLSGLLLALTLTFSCAEQKEKLQSEIPYMEAKNYFLKNNSNDSGNSFIKIESQEDFDKYFGAAATMSENGKPTGIDFSENYVIALTEKQTNKTTDIVVKEITKEDDNVKLTYSVKEGEENSYTIKPVKILIVSKKYDGNISLNKL